jgi:hypothetical protein
VGRQTHRVRIRADDGFQAIEVAILFPIVVLFALVGVVATRVALASNEVLGASRAAARAASLSNDSDAPRRARQAADRVLQGSSVRCSGGPLVELSYVRIGTNQAVQAQVRCAVELGDLGFGSRRMISARSEELIDPLRSGA